LLHHEGEMQQLGPDEFAMTKGQAKLSIRVSCDQAHQARLGTTEPNYEHTQRSVRPKEAPVLGELAIDIGPTAEAKVRVELTIGDG
jgi:hypothetical protein